MKISKPITLEWEGKKIGTATITFDNNHPPDYTVNLTDVTPSWLAEALSGSIVTGNAVARSNARREATASKRTSGPGWPD